MIIKYCHLNLNIILCLILLFPLTDGKSNEIIGSTKSTDYFVEKHSLPNDSLFSQQWGLHNENGADIQMLEAWEIEPGDPDVIMAIIDMGFDANHQDLQQNIWQNPGEIQNNGIDDDQNGYVDDIIGYMLGSMENRINIGFFVVGDGDRPENRGEISGYGSRLKFDDIWESLRVNETGATTIGNNNLEIEIDPEKPFFKKSVNVIYIPLSRMLWKSELSQ